MLTPSRPEVSKVVFVFFHYKLSWLTEDLQKLGNALKLDATNLSDWQHLFKTVASPLPVDENHISKMSLSLSK